MAACTQCDQRLALLERKTGICFVCAEKNRNPTSAAPKQFPDLTSLNTASLERRKLDEALSAIILTTESSHNLAISERIEIITAECVLGMNIFKDIGSSIRDLVGGRNESYQNALKDARKAVLLELRREAFQVGADAVVAVDLDYSEISGGGKSMIFLVASGTAVRLSKPTSLN
ncbi:MAG: hypothetical protein JWS10_3730 [Cypionkella sp.]|uniref:YbjQ family protein n=1 Tax=Cypionkella sp. TaxID=2811411 RepID=UPI002606B324|nr:YbjQ family protein [Cypionkella sp.]MDB5661115.1 hypothetical protein [Cypionkella sp.]